MRVLTAVSSILTITLIPTNAVAQDKEARGTLEEVVVTAQKRGVVENAQDVPVATYGFSGYALQDAVVVNLADLGELVPAAVLPPTAPHTWLC